MTTLIECADTAAAALAEKVRASKGNIDAKAIADVIETVLDEATSEREEGARQRLDDLQASMQERLTRLLDASPAVKNEFQLLVHLLQSSVIFGYYLHKASLSQKRLL
jgi:uncharacterized protein YdeI (YjbR/CyaY-like superfamily)